MERNIIVTTCTGVDTRNSSFHFRNNHGEIALGTKVSFMVENEDQWNGDHEGVLVFEDGGFKIKTEHSGTLTINRRYDVYLNTVRPI